MRKEAKEGGGRWGYWGAYQAILPPYSHKALKAETHGVERVHSLMRPYLAWLCRRSWFFSRSVEMMVYSLQLRFFLKVSGGSWASILS
jgi:IS1 family transposase